ncbi:hypothetical protein [Serinibacter arcticus]|uniref:Uncharacterized protein n=1 Tax=Serinibacter arcticus TaxID=1655435 RepID=A0A4Z1E2A5_9MICO|nr:hypothetical protein [Serinibacter arcticus]TGO05158.1 hypothetical protein SERN_1162 [Serinibacter arcticus]
MTIRPALATSAATVALLLGTTSAASAVPVDAAGADRQTEMTAGDTSGSSAVPDDLLLFASAVADLDLSLVWDEPSGHLRVSLGPGQSEEEVLAAAEANGVADRVTIVRAEYSLEDLTSLASELVSSGQAQWAAPAPDLSGVDIGVADAEASAFSQEQAPGPETDGIPVRIVEVGEVTAISDEGEAVSYVDGEGEAATPDRPGVEPAVAWGVGAIAVAILAGGAVMVRRLGRP